MNRAAVAAIGLIGYGLVMGYGGYRWGDAAGNARLAAYKDAQVQSYMDARRAHDARLAQAQKAADGVVLALNRALGEKSKKLSEVEHALRKVARGHVCFESDALRVLEQAPGVGISGAGMPPAPGPALDAGAGAASHAHTAEAQPGAGAVATDEDVAAWVVQAGAAFEACRLQANALIQWHKETGEPHGIAN